MKKLISVLICLSLAFSLMSALAESLTEQNEMPEAAEGRSIYLQHIPGEEQRYYYAHPMNQGDGYKYTLIYEYNAADGSLTPLAEYPLYFESGSCHVDEAERTIHVTVNGEMLSLPFSRQELPEIPRIYSNGHPLSCFEIANGTIMVPFRETVKNCLADVEWNGETQSAANTPLSFTGNENIVTFTVGSATALVNGTPAYMPEAAYISENGQLMVPLKFLVKSLEIKLTRYIDGALAVTLE